MPPDAADADAVLILRVARGDEAALAALISRHGRTVAAVATRYLGSAGEAEDVVQETFLSVWRNAGAFDPGRGSVAAWVHAIAARRAIDRLRRMKLRRFLGLGRGVDPALDPPDPAPGAAATAADRDALRRTRAAIAALPDRQRMAILLSAVAGLDTARIAETLDISPGAVEQLLVRARRSLRGQGLRDD